MFKYLECSTRACLAWIEQLSSFATAISSFWNSRTRYEQREIVPANFYHRLRLLLHQHQHKLHAKRLKIFPEIYPAWVRDAMVEMNSFAALINLHLQECTILKLCAKLYANHTTAASRERANSWLKMSRRISPWVKRPADRYPSENKCMNLIASKWKRDTLNVNWVWCSVAVDAVILLVCATSKKQTHEKRKCNSE